MTIHEHEHEHGHPHEHEHSHKHDDCCCGHDHGDHEDVATRSHTHFVTEHHYTPGHPDDCACEQCNSHAEYCDICGESLAKCTCKIPDEDMEKRVYILEGIDCANCAAKVEVRLKDLDGVDDVSITFATKQMKLSAKDPDSLIPQIQSIIKNLYSQEDRPVIE